MKYYLPAVTLLAAIAAPAGAVAIVNGSFEMGVDTGGSFVTLPAGSNGIDGWTVGGYGVDYVGPYWQASDGVRSVDLSGPNAGSVSQTIDTVAGHTYQVTFDLSGNPDGGTGNKIAVISISGSLPLIQTYTVTAGNSHSNMNWQTYSYQFTAFSDKSTLTFASAEYTPYGPALDNVGIVDLGGSGQTVPEPSVWALLLAGFGAVGLSTRRRRAKTVSA
jgi:choice-of-anchor C domain-containing protein